MRIVAAVLVLPVGFMAVSLIGALRTPGNEELSAKWADWLRDHHAVWVVNHLEASYFARQAPKVGGRPSKLDAVAPLAASRTALVAKPRVRHEPAALAPPTPVPLVVPGLAGEGHWVPTGPLVNRRPAMYVTEVRPDTVHTSVLTSVVWIDPTALRIRLVPGAREPGGTWPDKPEIDPPARRTIVAAFNGGFRFKDAHGGFYADGRVGVPLVDGAASVAFTKSGRVNVGMWGRDMRMGPKTASVLQNLVLLVDHGRPVPGINAGDTSQWGSTLGNKVLVWRSGIGITRSGALLYVAGPGLSAQTLADVLARSGAVRAMTLDINPAWVTFNFFEHPDPAHPEVVTGRKLVPAMHRPADRYLSKESRDFFTISTT